MIVMKFGGSSLVNGERIKQAVEIVRHARERGEELVVVCSALGGATDALIEMSALAAARDHGYLTLFNELQARHLTIASELFTGFVLEQVRAHLVRELQALGEILRGVYLIGECTPRSHDLVMSFGERLSTFLVCEYIKTFVFGAQRLDAREVVKTDEAFGHARVMFEETYQRVRARFEAPAPVCVVTGFIASTDKGETTTLGRGGSDLTASLFGAALGADEIQIWTDVDGVLTADPRLVKGTFSILEMSYEEAMEMSHFGAKVIYPPTIQPARELGIPIIIKNTLNPEHPGTRIIAMGAPDGPIKGISCIKDAALMRVSGPGMVGVSGTAGRMFQALARESVNVMMITQGSSEHSICAVIMPEDEARALRTVKEEFALQILQRQIDDIRVEVGLCVIAVTGEQMRNVPGIAGNVFRALGDCGVNVVAIAQGSSERNISIVVRSCEVARGMQAIHDAFFASTTSASIVGHGSVHLYVAGVGNISSAVLEQLSQIHAPMRLKGLINTKTMAIGDVAIQGWRDAMERGEPASWDHFVQQMKQDSSHKKIFVDCTSSSDIADDYVSLLESGISIVAANKKAMSGSREMHARLRPFVDRKQFRFEANVCAGLPVISTIQSLRETGDEILELEGVLSGTLSYLFNTYDGMGSFASLVGKAKELGYTEPDPREDLCGMDVARKLLILSRSMGLDMELADIDVEDITPVLCRNVEADRFLERLREHDEAFRLRIDQALAHGERLRYLGVVKDGKASVRLQAVGSDHPAFRLTGSDNIISIRTRRYFDHPLVIQGPGAGAQVTAAGVVTDILSCSHL